MVLGTAVMQEIRRGLDGAVWASVRVEAFQGLIAVTYYVCKGGAQWAKPPKWHSFETLGTFARPSCRTLGEGDWAYLPVHFYRRGDDVPVSELPTHRPTPTFAGISSQGFPRPWILHFRHPPNDGFCQDVTVPEGFPGIDDDSDAVLSAVLVCAVL